MTKKYPFEPRKLTAAERRAEVLLNQELMQLRLEAEALKLRDDIPSAWHDVESEHPCTPKKVKLTLTLDEDVVKYYRSMGRGFHARTNAILRTWMLARKAKMIRGVDDTDIRGEMI